MAISVSYLNVGSKISDSKGNRYILVAHNHYGNGQATFLSENCVASMSYYYSTSRPCGYEDSYIHSYLNGDYIQTLSSKLKEHILTTQISYVDLISVATKETRTISAKCFLLSSTELGVNYYSEPSKEIGYLGSAGNRKCDDEYWTRTELTSLGPYSATNKTAFACIFSNGYSDGLNGAYADDTRGVRPAFNVSHSLMVEEDVNYGSYRIVENIPPQIKNIPNMTGNYGSSTTINYTVINESGHNLTHYFSKDNGDTWQAIKPTKNGNDYYFSHVFNEVKSHYCRVKVVDTEDNSAISNTFTVSLNQSIPNITVLDHDKLTFRFKVSCATSEISKIEIYVNNALKKTITENLDFTQTYTIDSSLLTSSKNTVQIKATSKGGTTNTKGIEARKTLYDVPAVGSLVIINDEIYTVVSANKVGTNIVLNLKEQLVEKVSKGDLISILQDNVVVKCSLSDTEDNLDYKDMKLTKIKILKGQLAGYIEEKYVLEGKGRYSAIKLELERYNDSIDLKVAELQQMFDYLED